MRRMLSVRLVSGPDREEPHSRPDRARHHAVPAPRRFLCAIDGHRFFARPGALPLPDRSVCAVECLDQLESVRDDVAAIREFARVLADGGRLRLRTTATGPLAGFDAFNLFKYVTDITHRGVRPAETRTVGWRRHYPVADLLGMLEDNRFDVLLSRRSRFVLAEMVVLAAQMLFQWVAVRPDAYRRAQSLASGIARLEDRWTLSSGFCVTVEAMRRPDPPTPARQAPGERV